VGGVFSLLAKKVVYVPLKMVCGGELAKASGGLEKTKG
jgi:hypothetical protein